MKFVVLKNAQLDFHFHHRKQIFNLKTLATGYISESKFKLFLPSKGRRWSLVLFVSLSDCLSVCLLVSSLMSTVFNISFSHFV